MKKIILLGGAAVLVLLIGIIVTVILSIDSIIETAVNDFGPKITLTDVRLDSADIGIFSGEGKLNGLVVGNPVNRGFKPRNLFAMDQVRVAIDKNSLTSDTIVIKEVAIIAPKIAYELKDFSESNFDGLLKNIAQTTGGDSAAKKADEPAAESEGEAGASKKIIIENFVISGAEVTADMTGMPGEGMTLPLPEIHLTDIGKDEGGATPAETAEILVTAIYEGMQQAFADSGSFVMKGGKWIMEGGQAAAEEAAKAVEDMAASATEEAEGALEGAGDAVGGALEGVGKMFD